MSQTLISWICALPNSTSSTVFSPSLAWSTDMMPGTKAAFMGPEAYIPKGNGGPTKYRANDNSPLSQMLHYAG